jgi:dihydrofolate reductase
MKISLIVAMAQNRVIGRDNRMPWHLPEDLRYFKRITLNKPVVMGRNTFESIGKPLPQRTNIVITRNPGYRIDGAVVVNSLEAALQTCRELEAEEAMVIGGAQIYAQALPMADRLYLTEVAAVIDGDASFPDFDRTRWQEVGRESYKATDNNPYDYAFLVLEKSG